VDLFPTLCELCGLPAPERLESVSMVPLLRDPDRRWKKGALTTCGKGESVRTERWRYTEWAGGGAELYDHDNDPKEIVNLAKNPKHAATVAEMGRLLEGGWRACLPDG
jgi:uncharacterized sulfatase